MKLNVRELNDYLFVNHSGAWNPMQLVLDHADAVDGYRVRAALRVDDDWYLGFEPIPYKALAQMARNDSTSAMRDTVQRAAEQAVECAWSAWDIERHASSLGPLLSTTA